MSVAPRGRFITLEGGEGAGKSTQLRRLVSRLEAAGLTVVATREPGGSPRAEEIRALLLSPSGPKLGPTAEALLFAAARSDHLDRVIRPALARGEWVVCDRFFDSTRAYQGAAGGLEAGVLDDLERIAVGETRPDLTLILDLPPEIGLARAGHRRGAQAEADRFEQEPLAFHARLREGFRAIAAADPTRCVLLDATTGEDAVAERIWSAVRDSLHPGEGTA
jgi:dTMP kinase